MMGVLYEDDILAWSERQAALLRRVAAGEAPNEAPDWEHIIDEVESVGRSQVHAVESLLLQALGHMLKAQAWRQSLAAPGWRADASLFRSQARRRFAPSMRQKIDVDGLYADAVPALPETIDGVAVDVAGVMRLGLDDLLGG